MSGCEHYILNEALLSILESFQAQVRQQDSEAI